MILLPTKHRLIGFLPRTIIPPLYTPAFPRPKIESGYTVDERGRIVKKVKATEVKDVKNG
jgi:hypothetical protein